MNEWTCEWLNELMNEWTNLLTTERTIIWTNNDPMNDRMSLFWFILWSKQADVSKQAVYALAHDLGPDSQKEILSFILKLLQLSCKSYFFNAFFSKIHSNFALQET